MNSVHIASTERTIRWELLFAEEDCFDPLLLRESERNLRNLAYIAEAEVESEQLADGSHRVTVTTVDAWALSVAIAVSGLPASRITYVGFLPRRQAQRKQVLQTLSSAPGVLVAFEAPHRLLRTLSTILETLGDRQVAACREMTKIHEEVFRGSISEAIAHFSNPRGEFTLVIAGREGGQAPDSDEEALALASRLRTEGARAQEAVAAVAAATGLPRRKAYRIWLDSRTPS